ncbi:CCN family member 1-like [Rhinatrema bivittatum]|uniref:CCN family member 1-like n=1 Tax=Rhinatrema bivittatum TaxID=194408 RepID=UPI001125BC0F|nr:CCN family member 1-like [Rhinatrema bivittatum]
MQGAALTCFMVLAAPLTLVSCHCPLLCTCPSSSGLSRCAPGVSRVPDSCGCCKVCARQLNQDCGKLWPCDPHKGLECNYGADPLAVKGICRARREGRSCEYGGRLYQNGESFRPGREHRCTCIDGAVGCAPLLPRRLPPAGRKCPRPAKAPGRCCQKVVCPKGANRSGGAALDKANDFVHVGKERHWKDLPVWSPLFGGHVLAEEEEKCLPQTTEWSPCSRTCGMGESTRVSNQNPQCGTRKESRLCQVRPCDRPDFTKLKKGKKCLRTSKAREPVRYLHAGCESVQLYRPSYCGACLDGRCCAPLRTRTVRVAFRCRDGRGFSRQVAAVRSCRCGPDCGHLNEAQRPEGDIHGFTE